MPWIQTRPSQMRLEDKVHTGTRPPIYPVGIESVGWNGMAAMGRVPATAGAVLCVSLFLSVSCACASPTDMFLRP